MILDLNNPFEFTLREGDNTSVLKGFFRSLTISEQKNFKAKNKQLEEKTNKGTKLAQEVNRLNRLIEIDTKRDDWDCVKKNQIALDKIQDELLTYSETFNPDEELLKIWRERFELCLSGEHKTIIIELCENVGYQTVYDVIHEAIAEEKAKK